MEIFTAIHENRQPSWYDFTCACSFRVINQRKPLVFYFFQNATQANGFSSAATLAAQTESLPFTNYNEPTQVHLALTSKTGYVYHALMLLFSDRPAKQLQSRRHSPAVVTGYKCWSIATSPGLSTLPQSTPTIWSCVVR